MHMDAMVLQAHDVGAAAPWRRNPLTHFDALHAIRIRGKPINALLQLPFFSVPNCCRMDWLHVADQGVAAELAGNFFWYVQRLVAGRTIALRVAVMNGRLQDWYDRHNVVDRIDVLHANAFWSSRKLRCSAACMRSLVPFLEEVANDLLGDADPVEHALKHCCRSMHQCYLSLDNGSFFYSDVATNESTTFALHWVALHRYWQPIDEHAFKIKPKLHLFLHICSDKSRPRRYWAYRDEDYGGAVARRGRRRGGILSVLSCSRRILEKFWLQCPNFSLS